MSDTDTAQPDYPIPTDWLLGSLADVTALPSQFATDRQRNLLDSAHLFTQHADHLPALASAVHALHATHWPELSRAAHSALESLSDSDPLAPLQASLDQTTKQLTLIHSLQANHADLKLLLTVPTLLSQAVHAIHPCPPPSTDSSSSCSSSVDPLGTLVDHVFSLAASLAALDRRMSRRGSISASSTTTSPYTSSSNLATAKHDPTDPIQTTIALVSARARSIVHTDLPHALLAHLTLPSSPLPTLLRAVAHLRRIDPLPTASHQWAHQFLASRLARLPPPPPPAQTSPCANNNTIPMSNNSESLATDVALAWIDAVRGHMFDTWAHARVVFPDVHVHPWALYCARSLRTALADVLARLASPQDLALVARHAQSAWGTACRRLGWDLGAPVVRPVVDAELLARFTHDVQRAVEAAKEGLMGAALLPASTELAFADRPETWALASRPLAAFAAQVVDAVNAATFPRIPVAKLGDMARALHEALSTVGQQVQGIANNDKVWCECVVPHLCRSWDKVVEAAGIRGQAQHLCRINLSMLSAKNEARAVA